MAHPLVTFPWFDRQEVWHVFSELYSSDVRRQTHAVDRVKVWKSRALTRLPLAVESTGAFVKANIAFHHAKKPAGTNIALREQYGMAVIRFVNLFTERNQQKVYAQPVHVLASQLGVPSWIVDLRHSATHEKLPSLAELQAATNWCLEWLRTEFWEVQCMKPYAAEELKMGASKELCSNLAAYMRQKFEAESAEHEGLLSEIESSFSELGDEACPILVQDGYFVFTEEQLKNFDLEDEISQITTDYGRPTLHTRIITFWKPILMVLAKCELVSSLLLHIVSAIGKTNSLRNAFLCKWLYTIVFHTAQGNRKKSATFLQADIPYKTLLQLCLQIDNRFMSACIDLLTTRLNLSPVQKSMLAEANSMCLAEDAIPTPDDDTEDIIHTLNDIASFKSRQGNQIWTKCSDVVDWSRLPIGMLPADAVRYTSLELGATSGVDDDDDDDGSDDYLIQSDNVPDGMPEEMDTVSEDCTKAPWDNATIQALTEHIVVC